jgi:uncharacterized protein DUF6491
MTMKRSISLGNLVGRGVTAAAALAFVLGLGGVASARTDDSANESARNVEAGKAYEPVDSFILLTQPHSWTALDDDTVIVWTTPFRPYLVELAYPSRDLRFAHVIGVTSAGSRVYAKFDAVKVRGFRYPIDGIYKLTRDEAKALISES